MSKYFFSLHDDVDVMDADGTELIDLDAAREHAATVARELMFKRTGMLEHNWSRWTMSVRDSSGHELLSFALADCWDVQPGNWSNPAGPAKGNRS